jgi:hypothetical protein
VNLLQNSNFLGGFIQVKSQEKTGNVLFSGFLFTLLGASGIQAGLTDSLETFQNTPKEEVKVIVCQEQIGVKAIIADSTLSEVKANDKDKKEEVPTGECQQQKKIEETLEEETTLPTESEEALALAEAQKEEEKLYQEKVEKLEDMLEGHPLAKMAPEIAKQEPEIAALIVGIARKESQWGLRSPKKNGDCFNYWGYKGTGGRGVGMGYACFATREEAIEKISARLEKMINKRGSSNPSALVTPWKCGSSCATHSPESVRKWVSDVNQYYTKVLAMK